MLTILEILIIAANIPVLIWALLPVRRVPRFLDFMPLAAVFFLILHLFIDNETVKLRFIPLYCFTIIFFLVTVVRIFKHNPNQPKRRVLAAFGRFSGLMILVIAILAPTVILPFKALPEPTGKFDVGTVTCDLTDKTRAESFSTEPGKSREIAVQFWYPTDNDGSGTVNDISNAAVSTEQQNYPVLIFSHGAFGMRMSNASSFRELASHGYIVASIDHTYHSFYTSFPNGRSVPVNMKFLNEAVGASNGDIPAKETFDITHNWLKLRTADIEFVIDSIKSGELGTEGQLLNGHVNLKKIGLFGHSLGGAASAQVARERDEISAVIVIDGTMIGDITGLDSNNKGIVTDEPFKKPIMLMYNSSYLTPEGKESSYLPNVSAFSNATDAAYSLCIKDSGHLNFTDLPRISPFLSGMLGVGTVDSYECIKTVNDYMLAFFDKHLKGESAPLLDGTDNPGGIVFESNIPVGK